MEDEPLTTTRSAKPSRLSISAALDTPQEHQALTYYMQCHVERSNDWPELVGRWDDHLKYAFDGHSYSAPPILSLAISAVSHATFGKAQGNHAALTAGSRQYSKALVNINRALGNATEAIHDNVLLAVMLLSFYENCVVGKALDYSGRDIEIMGSASFAHHDGAMAMLKLRQQLHQRSSRSMELDKLVRRQLMRTCLLRSMPPPTWFQDGLKFGEQHGSALELDRCMVEAAKLRHQTRSLDSDLAGLTTVARPADVARLRRILARAQTLDDVLILWADQRPTDDRYRILTVESSGRAEAGDRIFDSTVHLYPSIGHAGLWGYYRTVRLIVNDIMLKILSVFGMSPGLLTISLLQATSSRVLLLANDLCRGIPYMLGLIEPRLEPGQDVIAVVKVPASLKPAVRASTAYFLCWPLNEAIMMSRIPDRHRHYIRDRLLDISEIVDDGVMAKVALVFSPMLD